MDVSDLSSLPCHVDELLKKFPDLDTVFLNAGIQVSFSFLDASTSSSEAVTNEINTNLTGPMILTHLLLPHLQTVASKGKSANLLFTGSGLAFIPLGVYPVYCPTMAAKHSFAVCLRQQIASADVNVQKNLAIQEIAAPYVDTDLDANHRDFVTAAQGGPGKAMPAMPLKGFLDKALQGMEELDEKGRPKKEVGVGFSQTGIDTWRGSFGKALEGMGIDA